MAVPHGQVEGGGGGGCLVPAYHQQLRAAGDEEVDSVQVAILGG